LISEHKQAQLNLLDMREQASKCQLCSCRWRDSDFIKSIFICVQKINKSRTGLERHQGEYDIFFIFGSKLSL